MVATAATGASTPVTPMASDEPKRLDEPQQRRPAPGDDDAGPGQAGGEQHRVGEQGQHEQGGEHDRRDDGDRAAHGGQGRQHRLPEHGLAPGPPLGPGLDHRCVGCGAASSSPASSSPATASDCAGSAPGLRSVGWSSTRGILPSSPGEGREDLDDGPGRHRVVAACSARPPTSTEQTGSTGSSAGWAAASRASEVTHGRDPGDALLVDARRGPGARPVPDEHRLSDAFDAFAAVHDRLS